MRNKLLLFLAGCVVSFGLGCASHPTAKKSSSAPAVAAKQNSDSARVVALKAELTPEPLLLVRTEGKPPFISYSPQPDVFVMDFAKTAKQPDLSIPTNLPPFIATVAADEAVEFDKPLTRVTFRFTRPVAATAEMGEEGVVVKFNVPAAEPETFEVPVTAGVVSEELTTSASVVAAAKQEPAPSRPATMLEAIETTGSGETLQVMLDANGAVEYSTMRLSNPLRLVVDLKGLRNKVKKPTINLGDPYVKRVRVAQFQSAPLVTRVVLDMDELVEYRVEKMTEGLRVAFGGASAPVEPVAMAVATKIEPETTVPAAMTGAADPQTYPTTPPQTPPPPPTPPSGQQPTMPSTVRSTPVENVFVEPPQQQPGLTTIGGGVLQPGERRELSPGERIYTGEPITLTLKDADIKDVLRTFAQLTGLNIAIDPQVTGTVTVQFENVPWDQALELILRQNGLTYVLQGNVMRVGTIERLAAEEILTRKLEQEKRLNVPLQTIIRRLSYAKSTEVQALAKELASPRGRIIVDPRTNQLIITDVPEYIPTILSLIENVDIPTPQVVIEARIVETTKDFARRLGIRWNFTGALDPALGTGTGLAFPNRVGIIGGPFSFAAGALDVLRFTLLDVLGTFDLDIALTAAESEGLARIVSAPKVTTQDNTSAEISSGIQVPVQTRVNFTTTTNYIDATLRLEVTPQITAADTVIMQISVQKTEPQAIAEGAQAPPLSTRRATTRVMVRDGGTTVIGGIYQAAENRSQARVPFVHGIPVVGNLFKSRVFTSRHDELLIFITPRIVRGT